MTLKKNRASLLSTIKLYASFYYHMWIQTGVTVRKRLSWVMTSVTLTFDLWPWSFAWKSLLSLVITPENFVAIRWQEHGEKGVTDRQTDRRTDRQTDRQKEVFLELQEGVERIHLFSDMMTKRLNKLRHHPNGLDLSYVCFHYMWWTKHGLFGFIITATVTYVMLIRHHSI